MPGAAIKRFPGVADDEEGREAPGAAMLLKLLFAVLVGYLLSRLLRRSQASRPPRRDRAAGRRLDPDRAVRASWSEVESDPKGGTGER